MPLAPAPLEFLAIGDTMLDVFVQLHEATVNCTINRSACQISFPFGDKIPVEGFTKVPAAGNASNAAIANARLGVKSSIYATVGNDPEAGYILKRWKEEGVQTNYVQHDLNQGTNSSTVLSFQGERTILVYHHHYAYDFPKKLPAYKRLYYTSMGEQHEDFEQQLIGYLARFPAARLTFQPGTYQLRRLARGTKEILQHTDILILNKEEAALFLENTDSEPIAAQLQRLQALGPRIVVITDGEYGSYAREGDHAWSCDRFAVPCIERTGAGDSYASAFTWAIDRGFSVSEAMRYGTANASSVIQFLGPHHGLLDREGLNRLLRKFSTVRPKPLPYAHLAPSPLAPRAKKPVRTPRLQRKSP